jgi:hypothetical protein
MRTLYNRFAAMALLATLAAPVHAGPLGLAGQGAIAGAGAASPHLGAGHLGGLAAGRAEGSFALGSDGPRVSDVADRTRDAATPAQTRASTAAGAARSRAADSADGARSAAGTARSTADGALSGSTNAAGDANVAAGTAASATGDVRPRQADATLDTSTSAAGSLSHQDMGDVQSEAGLAGEARGTGAASRKQGVSADAEVSAEADASAIVER